jgi:hypothetical protein
VDDEDEGSRRPPHEHRSNKVVQLNVDITNAVTRAIREYEKRTLRKENKIQDEAFATAEAEKNKSKRRDIECFNCERKGPFKSEFWGKGAGDEGGGPKNPQSKDKSKAKDGKDTANAAETESSEDRVLGSNLRDRRCPNRGSTRH